MNEPMDKGGYKNNELVNGKTEFMNKDGKAAVFVGAAAFYR